MTNPNDQPVLDTGDDLEITSRAPRDSAPGTWVRGSLNGYRFDALVFPITTPTPLGKSATAGSAISA